MITALIGTKKNMTSTYDARGRRTGATILEVLPNIVTQVKTADTKDGYNAVQLGIGTKKSLRKPQQGLLKKIGSSQNVKWLKEVRIDNTDVQVGKEINVGEVFVKGDSVKITGTSKGKGFQGVMRRHGFHGGSRTHGQSDRLRAPGAVSSGTLIGRVFKGHHMAGHMGSETVTVSGLEVVDIDKKNNLLTVKGAVPGAKGSLLMIFNTGKIKGYTPPPEPEPEPEEEGKSDQSIEGSQAQSDQNEVKEQEAATEEVKPEETQEETK